MITIYIVLSIFLHREDSAESMPFESRDKIAGKANE